METYIETRLKMTVSGIILFVAIGIMAITAEAQIPGPRARKEMVDVFLFGRELAICTRKEGDAQYLYVSRIDNHSSSVKENVLNQGVVNTIVGADPDHTELYVYHRSDCNEEVIAFYKNENGNWIKTGERKLPAITNYSNNFRLFMTEDKKKLVFSAQLSESSLQDDLYVSEWSNRKGWSKPKDLGKKVNTRLTESALYLRGNTLYFSREIMEEKYVFALSLKGSAKPAIIEDVAARKTPDSNINQARRDYAQSNLFEITRIK